MKVLIVDSNEVNATLYRRSIERECRQNGKTCEIHQVTYDKALVALGFKWDKICVAGTWMTPQQAREHFKGPS